MYITSHTTITTYAHVYARLVKTKEAAATTTTRKKHSNTRIVYTATASLVNSAEILG